MLRRAVDEVRIPLQWISSQRAKVRQQARDVEPGRSAARDNVPIAAPSPLLGRSAQPGLHGITGDVADNGPELRVVAHAYRAVSALEEMPGSSVSLVEHLGVPSMKALEAGSEVRPRKLDDQVNVIDHQAEGEASPSAPPRRAAEHAQIGDAIGVVEVDPLLTVAAGKDVVDAARDLLTRFPRHDPM